MKFMKIARRITGDINKSIVYYSKLGIFQSFIELDDINKLKKYVPCTITKLDNYDRKHNTELLHTLNSYIRNNLSVKKDISRFNDSISISFLSQLKDKRDYKY